MVFMTTTQQVWYGRMVRAILLDDATAVAELAYQLDDVNMLDDTGRTVLHIAVMHRRDSVLPPLLAAGADASIVNEYGMTPLGLAIQSGTETIARILRSARQDAKNGENGVPNPGGQPLVMQVRQSRDLRYVNLRSAPDNNARVVATTIPSTVLTVIGVSGAWVEVEMEQGLRGWAHSDWLDLPPKMMASFN
jgi:ankyrin repeat protein